MTEHRFPPPWTVEETPTCFIGRDANGKALNYTYYFTEEMSLGGEQYDPLTMLTKDDARRIAANIAKLPELLKNGDPPSASHRRWANPLLNMGGVSGAAKWGP